MAALAATMKLTPITASCTSGQRLSVQLSSSAPASAAPSAANCTAAPCGSKRGAPDADSHLRHCGVDEADAAPQHLDAERRVRRGDEQSREQRRPDDVESGGIETHCSGVSSRATRSSKYPKRSFARSDPPTVKGSITLGMPVRCERNCAAFGSS